MKITKNVTTKLKNRTQYDNIQKMIFKLTSTTEPICFFSGVLRRDISELSGPIAAKISSRVPENCLGNCFRGEISGAEFIVLGLITLGPVGITSPNLSM